MSGGQKPEMLEGHAVKPRCWRGEPRGWDNRPEGPGWLRKQGDGWKAKDRGTYGFTGTA